MGGSQPIPAGLEVRSVQNGNVLTLACYGAINEKAPEAFAAVKLGSDVLVCVIDLAAVSFVNSVGIMNFIKVMRPLCQGRRLYYEKCPPVFVDHLNMMPSLSQGVTVNSVQVTFACGDCGRSSDLELKARDFQHAAAALGNPVCPACATPMRPVEPLSEYLLFASNLS